MTEPCGICGGSGWVEAAPVQRVGETASVGDFARVPCFHCAVEQTDSLRGVW